MRRTTILGLLLSAGLGFSQLPQHAYAAPEQKVRPAPPAAQADAPVDQQTVTRVYYVSELAQPVPDYPFDGSPLPLRPPGNSSNSTAAPPSASLFGGSSPPTTVPKDNRTDDLIKLIMETVDPESWKDNGGQLGAARMIHGMLVVTQTPENQKKLESLLSQLLQPAPMVRVNAHWVLLPPNDLQKLLKPAQANSAPAALQEVNRDALQHLPGEAKHFQAQTVCHSGQTVHVASGHARSFVTQSHAVVGTDALGYDPTVELVHSGLMLQIAPTVNAGDANALVNVYSVYTNYDDSAPSTAVALGVATTRPASEKSHVVVSEASATIDRITTPVQSIHTTLRMPLNQLIVVGGMTLDPDTKGGDSPQLYLILELTASK